MVARHMMASMVAHPRPTCAEMTDVANAVFLSADAVVLGEETAIGNFPVQVVETMASIIRNAEEATNYYALHSFMRDFSAKPFNPLEAVSLCLARSSMDAPVSAIITFNENGDLAEMVSRFRPQVPHLMLTSNQRLASAFNMYFGVTGIHWPELSDSKADIKQGVAHALKVAEARGVYKGGPVAVLHGTVGLPADQEATLSVMSL
jgi:pyruvate kinase